ncbi:MAG: VOC family protein [Coriobacteriia bacterium]|nr:VOC family protein [Coriobacteriia bacterium]
MVGVEIDFVVPDCLEAYKLYSKVFPVEPVELTENEVGMNEAVFTIYGTRFHMLDENVPFQLIAPKPADPKPMWVNITVEDIEQVFNNAVEVGCTVIQPVTENEAFGMSNAIFIDPFGYIWMLHQIYREVSFEERLQILEALREEG